MSVRIETRNEITLLFMENPPENAFNSDMIQQFNKALDGIEADAAVRGVVVAGSGDQYFSAGMDIQYVMGLEEDAIK